MAAPWFALMMTLWLVVTLLTITVLGLIRRISQLEAADSRVVPTAVARLAVGDQLPAVGGFENLATVESSGVKRLILFLSSTCGPCKRLAGEIQGDSSKSAPVFGNVALILVTDTQGVKDFADLGASDIVGQTASQITRAWGIPGTPFAVAVDEAGTVSGSGFAGTRKALREIARTLEPSLLR